MAALRSRVAVFLYKTEATEGVDAAPTAGANAIRIEGRVQMTPTTQTVQPDESEGSLDSSAHIPVGTQINISQRFWLRGSGTPGTPSDFAAILKTCGLGETITASPVGAPTAAAAGTTTTVTAAAPFAATSQLYRGMPLVLAVNPAAGSWTQITDYTVGRVATLVDKYGVALDNTTTLQIPINVLYAPVSTGIPSGTAYWYQDGRLFKALGCRGSVAFSVQAGKAMACDFKLQGIYGGFSDAAVPAATYDSDIVKPVWRNLTGLDGAALLEGAAVACAQMSVDFGNGLTTPPNPNTTEGFDPAVITTREISGMIDPQAALVATRDEFTAMRQGTRRKFGMRMGQTAGNRIAFCMPAIQHKQFQPGDSGGIARDTIPFRATGYDSGAFLAFY